MGMLLRQSGGDSGNGAGVMFGPRDDVENFLLRLFPRHHQLGGALSIKLPHVGLVHSKQGDGIRRDRLEGASGHPPTGVEEWPEDHPTQNTLALVFTHPAAVVPT